MFDHTHFSHGIGQINQFRFGATAGDQHMLHGRAGLQVGEHLLKVEVTVLERDIQLIEHYQANGRVAQHLAGHFPRRFSGGDIALAILGFPGKAFTHDVMSRLAREELVHHEQVMRLMKKRKIELRQLSAGRYASALRKVVRNHEPVKLVDTLVVGAFIEARSCERFEALVPHLDEELGKFYFGLLKSEARHFQGYLKLAYQYGDAKDIAQVIERVRAAEQELIESPDVEFRFHSGVPAAA